LWRSHLSGCLPCGASPSFLGEFVALSTIVQELPPRCKRRPQSAPHPKSAGAASSLLSTIHQGREERQRPRFLAKFGLFKRAVWWYNKSVHGKNGAFENKSLWHWA